MSYLVSGNNPAAIKTAERNIFTATASQTTFTISQGYQPGDIDVYLNGIRLVDSDDYYATNGSTVVLTSGATVGDSLVVVCYRPYQVTDFYTKSEQDTRYVNATGDTITGPVVINSAGNDRLQITSGAQSVYLGLDSNGAAIAGGAGQTGPGVYLYNTEGSVNLFTNSILRVKVDSSGRMTNPYQPSFMARITAGMTLGTSVTKLGSGYYTEDFDTANNFDHTVGTFNAPVSGRYLFSCSWAPNSTGRMNTYWYVNGVAKASVASANGGASSSVVLKLIAGDTVEIYIQSSTGSTVAVDNSGFVSGFLIG
jgi:hypothetical protein